MKGSTEQHSLFDTNNLAFLRLLKKNVGEWNAADENAY